MGDSSRNYILGDRRASFILGDSSRNYITSINYCTVNILYIF